MLDDGQRFGTPVSIPTLLASGGENHDMIIKFLIILLIDSIACAGKD